MTTLISEMKIPKPQRDVAPAASTRLMLPRTEPGDSLTKKLLGAQQAKTETAENGTADLLLRGLVDRLPKPNTIWPPDDRARWLRTAVSVFDLVYEPGEGEQREIGVGPPARDLKPRFRELRKARQSCRLWISLPKKCHYKT